MRYEWSADKSYGVSAQTVGEELERIERTRGECTPAGFVAEAADPGSPLHSLIEWDDRKAAYAHRLQQARHVIRSVQVVIHEADPIRVQAFVSVRQGDGSRRYVPHVRLVSDEDLWLEFVLEVRGVVNSWRRKLSGFERFRELVLLLDDKVA